MRKCCCWNVKTGAVILGFLNFVAPILIIVPLAGYLSGTDIEGLNVIKENQKVLEKVFEGVVFISIMTRLKYVLILPQIPSKATSGPRNHLLK